MKSSTATSAGKRNLAMSFMEVKEGLTVFLIVRNIVTIDSTTINAETNLGKIEGESHVPDVNDRAM